MTHLLIHSLVNLVPSDSLQDTLCVISADLTQTFERSMRAKFQLACCLLFSKEGK